jgi:hypothetical protein
VKRVDDFVSYLGLALVAAALLHGCAAAPKPRPTLENWGLCAQFCGARGELMLGLLNDEDGDLACACLRPAAAPEKKPFEAYARPPALGVDPRRPGKLKRCSV